MKAFIGMTALAVIRLGKTRSSNRNVLVSADHFLFQMFTPPRLITTTTPLESRIKPSRSAVSSLYSREKFISILYLYIRHSKAIRLRDGGTLLRFMVTWRCWSNYRTKKMARDVVRRR